MRAAVLTTAASPTRLAVADEPVCPQQLHRVAWLAAEGQRRIVGASPSTAAVAAVDAGLNAVENSPLGM
jgi:hypothetical protein